MARTRSRTACDLVRLCTLDDGIEVEGDDRFVPSQVIFAQDETGTMRIHLRWDEAALSEDTTCLKAS